MPDDGARLALEDRKEPAWLDRACIVIPAFDAESTLEAVVRDLGLAIPELHDAIFVVDDGSRDGTARIARELGCTLVQSSMRLGSTSASSDGRGVHGAGPAAASEAERAPDPRDETRGSSSEGGDRRAASNRGKGAALRAGFQAARARGMKVALTVDADGQHPAPEARRVLFDAPSATSLVLGVRDLARDGAPRANRVSNGISNYFLSRFAGRQLHDTQCGLRRYPIDETLTLGARSRGYGFEAETLLRAVWAGIDVVEVPVMVRYPSDRRTHFRVSRDPWRILGTVLFAVGQRWLSSEPG